MRKMMTLLVVLLVTASAWAQTTDPYPFPVMVGDQAAAKEEGEDNFAVVKSPVAAGAKVAVKEVEGQVIVNLFPSDKNGEVKNGEQPLILLFQAGKSKSLGDNMGGKEVKTGYYVANVVANGKTSRVFFQVK